MTITETTSKGTATASPALKGVLRIKAPPGGHWVGDGFPVRTMFHYEDPDVSPFLLLDHAGPYEFAPADTRRGVGEHPHRGFETVTIVYKGEVEHRDSSGGGGKIGPGDVQWMTAGGGLVHEEMHSWDFTKAGGTFHAVQLWVNLPAKDKLTPPKYQTLVANDIPEIALPDDAGTLRVIAGECEGHEGPASTFTPVELFDVELLKGKGAVVPLPEGHMAALLVMKGKIVVNGSLVRESEFVTFDKKGSALRIDAHDDAKLLVLGGEPIFEPVAGYGPFVMNTRAELQQAVQDFNVGKMGCLPPAE
jgi:redox-sensitive bicupin YhaK (pirin superfamily)